MRKAIDSYCLQLAEWGIIPLEKVHIYGYGLELLTSSLMNIALVLILSMFLHQGLSSVFFLIGFIPMRLYAGGYHADNHLNCTLVFTGIYLLSIVLCSFWLFPLIVLGLLAEIVLLYFLSPVPSPNKKISEEKKRKNRDISFAIWTIHVILYGFCVLLQYNGKEITAFFIGGFLAVTTLIAGKIKNNFTTRKEKAK